MWVIWNQNCLKKKIQGLIKFTQQRWPSNIHNQSKYITCQNIFRWPDQRAGRRNPRRSNAKKESGFPYTEITHTKNVHNTEKSRPFWNRAQLSWELQSISDMHTVFIFTIISDTVLSLIAENGKLRVGPIISALIRKRLQTSNCIQAVHFSKTRLNSV